MNPKYTRTSLIVGISGLIRALRNFARAKGYSGFVVLVLGLPVLVLLPDRTKQ